MSFEVKIFQKAVSDVAISSRRLESEKTRLPMKLTDWIVVKGPSLISKTKSTRFCANWMTFGSTVAA